MHQIPSMEEKSATSSAKPVSLMVIMAKSNGGLQLQTGSGIFVYPFIIENSTTDSNSKSKLQRHIFAASQPVRY